MLEIQALGDAQAEHRIAQEFQAFVGRQIPVLVRVRAVGEREPEQIRAHLHAQRFEKAGVVSGIARCGCVHFFLTGGHGVAVRSPDQMAEVTWRPL